MKNTRQNSVSGWICGEMSWPSSKFSMLFWPNVDMLVYFPCAQRNSCFCLGYLDICHFPMVRKSHGGHHRQSQIGGLLVSCEYNPSFVDPFSGKPSVFHVHIGLLTGYSKKNTNLRNKDWYSHPLLSGFLCENVMLPQNQKRSKT